MEQGTNMMCLLKELPNRDSVMVKINVRDADQHTSHSGLYLSRSQTPRPGHVLIIGVNPCW